MFSSRFLTFVRSPRRPAATDVEALVSRTRRPPVPVMRSHSAFSRAQAAAQATAQGGRRRQLSRERSPGDARGGPRGRRPLAWAAAAVALFATALPGALEAVHAVIEHLVRSLP